MADNLHDTRSTTRAPRIWGRVQFGAALSATFISIVIGVCAAPPPTMSPTWPWLRALGPLERAPIPPGTRLLFVPPPGTPEQEGHFWLYEARWHRPDLLWSMPLEWPLADAPKIGVAVGFESLPSGWHEVWRQGELCLAQRDPAR